MQYLQRRVVKTCAHPQLQFKSTSGFTGVTSYRSHPATVLRSTMMSSGSPGRGRPSQHQILPTATSTRHHSSPLLHRPAASERNKADPKPYRYEHSPEPLRRRHRRLISWVRKVHPTRRLWVLYSLLLVLALYLTIFRTSAPVRTLEAQTTNGRATTMATAARQHQQDLINKSNRIPLPPITSRHPIHNGRLQVSPNATHHPIHQLIQDARDEWDAKLSRQSRTLSSAVKEYKRRYNRPPPRGFDKWWQYVIENNVQLPDEYDQLDRDLHLFWALHPRDLQRRIEDASSRDDTFTIKVRRGVIRTSGKFREEVEINRDRRDGQWALMHEIATSIPDMDVVYSLHDTPWSLISWGHRQTLLEFIENDEYIDEGEEEPDLTYTGWKSACPPGSPAHRTKFTPSRTKSFISDTRANMDICQNPSHITQHGVLTGKEPVDEPLSALFSISKTSLHGDILGVPPERVAIPSPVTWGEKNHSRLLWRGSNTGMYYHKGVGWRDSHRVRLVALGMGSGEVDVLSPTGTGFKVDRDVVNSQLDLAFVGDPIQCDERDGTCNEIRRYRFAEFVDEELADRHKFVIDVDGNGWSARFQRLMGSGSLVFKSTIMPEWWNDRIQPWFHYIPVKLDYSDVHDALAFFAGIGGEGGEDDLAAEIARQGSEWASKFYRKEDMTAYVFRLYLEWARLQSSNRGQMVYDE